MSHQFSAKGMLQCGAIVSILQRERGTIIEVEVTPAEGTKIEDTAWIKDGLLRVNLTTSSLLGLYQLIGAITTPPRRRFSPRFKGLLFGLAISLAAWYTLFHFITRTH